MPNAIDFDIPETDTAGDFLVFFFDLRDRETFIQVTNTAVDAITGDDDDDFDTSQDLLVHIQIFDVNNNCNENNFFDIYTPNDTHVYNMRDIQTNDGNPSGVVLPDSAFGFVFALPIESDGTLDRDADVLIGNFRILDDNGYEYRTNANVEPPSINLGFEAQPIGEFGFFNYNTLGDITLSDIAGVVYDEDGDEPDVSVAEVLDNFVVLNVDIFDINEIPFSCRDVVFACVTDESPLLEELLETAADNSSGSPSVAAAEYGINDAIPHSKGGKLLCPGNNISEGFVRIEPLNMAFSESEEGGFDDISIFVGLNNGNGRGSMDSFWVNNVIIEPLIVSPGLNFEIEGQDDE